jgi:hypothetical protein
MKETMTKIESMAEDIIVEKKGMSMKENSTMDCSKIRVN